MKRAPSGLTTHPVSNTGDAVFATPHIVIQWAYPSLLTSPLVDGMVFGRGGKSSVLLPGHDASRQHASVGRSGSLPTLQDLDSRNGTWVNGRRITEHPIGPGDVVRIGEWIGVVLELPDPPPKLDFSELAAGWYGGVTLARAIDPARRVAPTDLPVIVQGETGTGKEGLARAIHAWSARSGPFVAVNCAAIPSAMAEAELFGYRKGAFTGADRSHLGFFRAAHGGTLFLDEIVDLPLPLQTKLLRVLEQHEVQSLGEPHPVRVDARVVSATQEALPGAVAERRFRPDLMARLDGLTVLLPPLRRRREDVAPLFARVLHEQTGGRMPDVEPRLVEALLLYDWPLNVRELVLLVRQLLAIHAHEPTLKRAMLPPRIVAAPGAATPSRRTPPARAPTDDDDAIDRLVNALRQHDGNVSRAAKALGISRSRAYRLLDTRPGLEARSRRDEREA